MTLEQFNMLVYFSRYDEIGGIIYYDEKDIAIAKQLVDLDLAVANFSRSDRYDAYCRSKRGDQLVGELIARANFLLDGLTSAKTVI